MRCRARRSDCGGSSLHSVVMLNTAPVVNRGFCVVLDVEPTPTTLEAPPAVSASLHPDHEFGTYDSVSGLTHRRLRPSDMHECVTLHRSLFPIEYEQRFYEAATHEHENVLTVGAFQESTQHHAYLDEPHPQLNSQVNSRMIAVVTARVQNRCDTEDDAVGRFLRRDTKWAAGRVCACWRRARSRLANRLFTNGSVTSTDGRGHTTSHTAFGGSRANARDGKDNYTPYLYILTVGVDRAWRRRGLAGALLEAICARAARDAGCVVVYLHVIAHDVGALSLYTSLGFTKVGTHCDFYTLDPGQGPVPGKTRYDAALLARACVLEATTTGSDKRFASESIKSGGKNRITSPLGGWARRWDLVCASVINSLCGGRRGPTGGRRNNARRRIDWGNDAAHKS